MNPTRMRTWLLPVLCALASGCSFSPPERPAYTGADQVDSASVDQLIGQWRVREINPIEESGDTITLVDMDYRPDGRVVGTVEPSESLLAVGITGLTMSADWSLEGDIVTHRNVEMETEGDSALGGLVSGIVNRSSQNLGGSANIYEMSDARMVMVGEDGAAMEYTRQ